MAMTEAGKNRIMIYGPKADGIIEFKTAAGEALAISTSGTETAVIRHFQERMTYGLVVPEDTSYGQEGAAHISRASSDGRIVPSDEIERTHVQK